jgi:hypothetical protein
MTPESRADFLSSKLNITKDNTSNYSEIDSLLAKLGGAVATAAAQVESAG